MLVLSETYEGEVKVMEINRREFFSGRWLRTELVNQQEKNSGCQDYFASLETCYAFLSEVPLEDLQNEANKRSLAYDGLGKMELARLLFANGEYRS
jgi:hypothetical protein